MAFIDELYLDLVDLLRCGVNQYSFPIVFSKRLFRFESFGGLALFHVNS